MSNRSFKVVAFHRKPDESTPNWGPRGKAGTQYKKRIYTSEHDFNFYGHEWMTRHSTMGLDVMSYELLEGDWMPYKPALVMDLRRHYNGWRQGGHERECPACGKDYIGNLKSTSCADCAFADKPAHKKG
jgi:hypothetical protein